jgi:hypothetical protein
MKCVLHKNSNANLSFINQFEYKMFTNVISTQQRMQFTIKIKLRLIRFNVSIIVPKHRTHISSLYKLTGTQYIAHCNQLAFLFFFRE